jgi:cytochrome oxidase Cu insertion factor (SCO1/SenC/PrrC family)
MAAFSERHDLDDVPAWHALTGDREALASTWRNYGIDPGIMLNRSHDEHDGPATPGGHENHASPEAETETETDDASYLLAHTDAIYIIDSEGRQRALLRSNANPTDLANNLTALLP